MGSRGLETLAPNRSGYTPVNLVQRNGQYYNYTPPAMGNPMLLGPRMLTGKAIPEKGPQGTYTPINFGGGSGGGRYGSARPYGSAQRYISPNSSYRAPATYGQPRQQPMQGPASNSYGGGGPRVPSFDPDNPQDDAIKDPKLRKAAKQLNKQAPPGERLAFINPKEEELLKAVGGSGMTAAGGVPSYKKGDVEAPPPRDYKQETRDTLEAQVELAPELYESEAQFRPQYANLERGIMLENLGLDPNMGLLDAFRQISGAQKDIQYDATAADIDMIRAMGPALAEAQRSADPEADALRQAIMADASAGLERGAGEFSQLAQDAREDYMSGEGLTAMERRDLDQQVLAGAADRGMEGQASTLEDQIAQRLSSNREIRNQRRNIYERSLANEQAAQQQALQNAGVAYSMGNFDPLLALTGRTGNAPMMAQQGFGGAGFTLDSSPGIFNPESQYAGQLATQNFQGIMDARTATAANRAGMFSGIMGGLGALGGGAFAGAGAAGGFGKLFCWVAREVYGENNPAWILFRQWMLGESPSWFRNLYIQYGERFAQWISDKPRIKSIIRKWMDSKIGGK